MADPLDGKTSPSETYVSRVGRELADLRNIFRNNRILGISVILILCLIAAYELDLFHQKAAPSDPTTGILKMADQYHELLLQYQHDHQELQERHDEEKEAQIKQLRAELDDRERQLRDQAQHLDSVVRSTTQGNGSTSQAPSQVLNSWLTCVQRSTSTRASTDGEIVSDGGLSGEDRTCDARLRQGLLNSTGQNRPQFPSGQPIIVKAVVQRGTTIELPPGALCIYGMATGGGAPSTAFETGQYAQVVNAAGQLSAALAYGRSERNSFTTGTGYHSIAGVSISGSWRTFDAFHGLNSQPGASDASVRFSVRTKSLVVVMGLASSQQQISLSGIPLENDAADAWQGAIVGHAYLEPGTYTVAEHSAALAAGQDPQHMADLIGVFVFGSS